uniref:Uncharacterized protein n=1 Tax=Arundo donax TaxID=35708 RepID=A0A0A9D3N6_ARUDO
MRTPMNVTSVGSILASRIDEKNSSASLPLPLLAIPFIKAVHVHEFFTGIDSNASTALSMHPHFA